MGLAARVGEYRAHPRLPRRVGAASNPGGYKTMPEWAKLKAPDCPNCNKPLRIRFRKDTGARFWACRNYPLCKTTASI